MYRHQRETEDRRGVITVLTAVLIVVMLAMLAFAVDIGYLSLTRTQLQNAADAAALAAAASICDGTMTAAAQEVANANYAGGHNVVLRAEDVVPGVWDADSRTFTPSTSTINATKVTVRTSDATGGATPLFFARVFGWQAKEQSAQAVAVVNPRDICFVVDLSASMNYDTRPDRANTSTKIALIQKIYDDFGWGTYPGLSENIGTYSENGLSGTGITSLRDNLLTTTAYQGTIYFTGTKKGNKYYDIDGTVLDATTRNYRAYSWVIDKQIGEKLMPNAFPRPNSQDATSRAYWLAYINDSIGANEKGSSYPISSRLGYASYLQFLMVAGRDKMPGSSRYTSMSINASDCLYHQEPTDAGYFSFPAQEQPTHAARRAIIAALNVVKNKNINISDPKQKDWVSIVTFDTINGTTLVMPLTDNYTEVMNAATKLQACASGGACTATEKGLLVAYDHIKPVKEGGSGRLNVNKVIVLLTDGAPNLKVSSDSTITSYIGANPSPYWPSSNKYEQAAAMQIHMMQKKNWYTYPIGLGLDVNLTFMDKLANMAATAAPDGSSFSSTDPTKHEQTLKEIFAKIITRPKLRLVQ